MNHTSKISIIALALASAGFLTACGTYRSVEESQAKNRAHEASAIAGIDRLADSVKVVSDNDVDRPYVSGKSVPLAREVTLPHALRQGVKTEVVFKGASRVDLQSAAYTLSQALAVPVRVRSDALLPASRFQPKSSAAAGAEPAASAEAVTVNMAIGEMPAAEILDYITAQTGTYWRYENGVVEIYRLVTRTFEVHAQQGKVSVSTGLGRSGSQGGSFESSSQTKVEQTGLDPLQEIKAAVDGMLTKGGTVVAGNGALVVTDTKESVDTIAIHIERENKALTRRIKLMFEAIEVTSRDNNEVGLNWDLVYDRLARLSNGSIVQTMLGTQSPVAITGAQSGTATFALGGSSQMSGSSLMLKALSDVGSVVNHTRVPMMTLNRRPVQYAVRTNFDYVSSIQVNTVASSAGTTTAPAITQKEETVGTVLTVTPSAFDGGQILMNLAYDNTILRSLEPYSAGGSALSTVQQKTIDGSGTVQSISIRSGQTLVISGIEKIANQFDNRRLDKDLPIAMGGSSRNKSTRSTTVLLVTAVSEDGI